MLTIHRSQLRLILAGLGLAALAAAVTAPISASADSLDAFSCTDRTGGVAGAGGTVTAIRIAHHDGYDRLVIGLATANSMPAYRLTRQNSATFVRDASGQPVTLAGSAGIRVALQNSDIADGVPGDMKPQLPEIREVGNIGNFERVVSYGVGLRDAACFRVLELSSPTRLVIDVETAPGAPGAGAAAASLAPSQSSAPADLAATGHTPAVPSSGGGLGWGPQLAAILLGLLAVTAGLAIVGLRQFVRK